MKERTGFVVTVGSASRERGGVTVRMALVGAEGLNGRLTGGKVRKILGGAG